MDGSRFEWRRFRSQGLTDVRSIKMGFPSTERTSNPAFLKAADESPIALALSGSNAYRVNSGVAVNHSLRDLMVSKDASSLKPITIFRWENLFAILSEIGSKGARKSLSAATTSNTGSFSLSRISSPNKAPRSERSAKGWRYQTHGLVCRQPLPLQRFPMFYGEAS